MIGVFDSGLGGLTVFRTLAERFPSLSFAYLGDHANVPYGDRPSCEVVELTRAGVERLFALQCRLVLLGCNTATAVAARTLQQNWLPSANRWHGHNVLGIVAPTVEAATQTPWAVTTPQYPQKHNADLIVVFGTTRTIASNVYPEEISKRCPRVSVVQQACPGLVAAIEAGAEATTLGALIDGFCEKAIAACNGRRPDRVILGCTHFPIVADMFSARLPAGVRILSQPDSVADSLEDYLERHPDFVIRADGARRLHLMTTGVADLVGPAARRLWADAPALTVI
ncbi:MAG: aspartate/glutamate racemase family protein [Alphaproteobacteria bacterium]|nr:aspartate/glutamate racemase family protein [Alphaproteobacteria bacterium]